VLSAFVDDVWELIESIIQIILGPQEARVVQNPSPEEEEREHVVFLFGVGLKVLFP
jgi:hypothetical protein